ncbi:hypothetical protein F53441_1516 [Fusarium austroafricanum]|uniref:Uncharacterized protein n=1 Tax=Fusarium austroafricanum TaxID=2364996 RepID=A0A8H4KUA9_9HYPO|nr:hypothetical protein F53441_1516 [Fusarium austroafricanum]
MASSPASPSRLKVNIQTFDQVIALSQAHINQTLKHNFTFTKSNKDLLKFGKDFNGYSLYGDLKPPSIGVIASDQGEKALLYLEFKDGSEFFWTENTSIKGADGRPAKATAEIKQISASGWRLAFLTTFSLQEVAKSDLPNQVAAVTSELGKPGDYSISRLIIDFGNAKHLTLVWEECLTPGLTGETKDKMKSHIQIFFQDWFDALRISGNYNVLGYTAKVNPTPKVLEQANKDAPHLSPTALRLQTMIQPSSGEVPNEDGHLNAILFTEMTEQRSLPKDKLPWSGDLFYQSIGGTLAMSKTNFWERFIKPKLQVVNQENLKLMNHIAWLFCDQSRFSSQQSMFTNPIANSPWVVQPKEKGTFENVNFTFNKDSNQQWREEFKNETTRKMSDGEDKWTSEAYCRNDIRALPGTGLIRIESDVYVLSTRQITGSLSLAVFALLSMTRIRWTTFLNLQAIENGGALDVKVTTEEREVDCRVMPVSATIFDNVPVLKSYVKDLGSNIDAKTKDIPNLARNYIKGLMAAQNTAKQLSDVLNGQGRFIFPGGGTFDMKDPIFSKNEDLLIGLSYKQGQDKSA